MGARPRFQETPIVTVVRRPADLAAIVPAWEELARGALEPNPFYEHWMLRPALEAFGEKSEIILVWRGARLIGLFPFQRVRRYKGLPASALISWQHAYCLLCTPLVHADSARLCLEALRNSLDASLLEFRYIPAGEPFHRALLEVFACTVNRSYPRGLLRKHRATISGRFRRQAAANERKLSKKGELTHLSLEPGDDIDRWIEDFLELEAGGWKGRNGSAMASSDASRRYFHAIVAEAFRRGRLLGCGLDVAGRPIARRLSFSAGLAAYAFKTAYDESCAEFSPGAMLELDNVRQVDTDPCIQWMDSFTDGDVLALERLWPDRRVMQTLVAGVGPWGRAAAAALGVLRWLKRRISSARGANAGRSQSDSAVPRRP